MDYGQPTMDHRLWTIDYRLSTMDYGLSTIDYGLSTIIRCLAGDGDVVGVAFAHACVGDANEA